MSMIVSRAPGYEPPKKVGAETARRKNGRAAEDPQNVRRGADAE